MCITSSSHPQVSVASVVHAVNGEVLAGKLYDEVLGHLKGWQPPLRLTFRRQVCRREI
jgi:hypothetical protein